MSLLIRSARQAVLVLVIVLLNPRNSAYGQNRRERKCTAKGGTVDEKRDVHKRIQMLKRKRRLVPNARSIEIDVYFTIFRHSTGKVEIDDATIQAQMDVLNEGYSQTPFQFNLRGVQRPVYNRFYANFERSEDPRLIGSLFRKGDLTDLNVYVGNAESSGSYSFLPYTGGLDRNMDDGGTFSSTSTRKCKLFSCF